MSKLGWCIDGLHAQCRHTVKVSADTTLVCSCSCHEDGE